MISLEKNMNMWKIRRIWWTPSGEVFTNMSSPILGFNTSDVENSVMFPPIQTHQKHWITAQVEHDTTLPAISTNPKGQQSGFWMQFTMSLCGEHVIHGGSGSKKQSKHATVFGCFWNLSRASTDIHTIAFVFSGWSTRGLKTTSRNTFGVQKHVFAALQIHFCTYRRMKSAAQ